MTNSRNHFNPKNRRRRPLSREDVIQDSDEDPIEDSDNGTIDYSDEVASAPASKRPKTVSLHLVYLSDVLLI
jgi:hypothetical protein